MIDFIVHSIKKIRLCMISYAGLSNNRGDAAIFLRHEKCFSYVYFILTFVVSFIGVCKMVKSIVVDYDSHIESLRRYSLLHGDKNKIELFKSRSGCVKRST